MTPIAVDLVLQATMQKFLRGAEHALFAGERFVTDGPLLQTWNQIVWICREFRQAAGPLPGQSRFAWLRAQSAIEPKTRRRRLQQFKVEIETARAQPLRLHQRDQLRLVAEFLDVDGQLGGREFREQCREIFQRVRLRAWLGGQRRAGDHVPPHDGAHL